MFGTVRLLALPTALHEADPPRLTVIEEIDHGLHPHALDILVDRMRSVAGVVVRRDADRPDREGTVSAAPAADLDRIGGLPVVPAAAL